MYVREEKKGRSGDGAWLPQDSGIEKKLISTSAHPKYSEAITRPTNHPKNGQISLRSSILNRTPHLPPQ